MKFLNTNNKLQHIFSIFLDNNANANDIDEAGQLFLIYYIKLSVFKLETTLDNLRYKLFAITN